MKLIRNLPTRIINGKTISFAIFWCDGCEREVEKPLSDGKRAKSCGCQKNKLISMANKGKKLTEEHKQKIKESHKGMQGQKHSEETKQKIREKAIERLKNPENTSMYGKKHSEETRQKMRDNHADYSGENNPMYGNSKYIGENNPFYGKKHTEKIRQLMKDNHADYSGENNPMYGKKYTKEQRQNISNSLKGLLIGDKNGNWNNGSSFEPYGIEFNKEKKQQVLERDNYTCQDPNCEHLSERLNVHHIDYDKKNNTPENLIILCAICHTKSNFNRVFWVEFYQNIMMNRIIGCLL
ncbi:MAG: NUMOD3 domain-containing DNA-binding protein [Nanoarchaeota archaeon]